LLVLAAALNVAPVALLYPPPYNENVEVTPGAKMSRIAAVERFSGAIDPLSVDYDEEFKRNTLKLWQARHIRDVHRQRRNIVEQIRILGETNINCEAMEGLTDEHRRLTNLLEELRIGYGW